MLPLERPYYMLDKLNLFSFSFVQIPPFKFDYIFFLLFVSHSAWHIGGALFPRLFTKLHSANWTVLKNWTLQTVLYSQTVLYWVDVFEHCSVLLFLYTVVYWFSGECSLLMIFSCILLFTDIFVRCCILMYFHTFVYWCFLCTETS